MSKIKFTGEVVWRSKDGNLFVTEGPSHRYLYETGFGVCQSGWQMPIAEQSNLKGDVEAWAKKKVREREKSTSQWLDKLMDKITQVEEDHKAWVRRKASV